MARKHILEVKFNFAHTPVVSVVEYKDKHLSINVTPDVFSLNFDGEVSFENLKEMTRIVMSYFQCLPETPITAVGVNVHGELKFQSEKEMGEFQERWFKPSALSDYLKEFQVNWGSTAKFRLPKTGVTTTLKIEPGPLPLVMSFLTNGHFDVKGTAEGIGVLQGGPVEVLSFSTTMMSDL